MKLAGMLTPALASAALLACSPAARSPEPAECGQGTGAPLCTFAGGPARFEGAPRFIDGMPYPFYVTRSAVGFTDAGNRRWIAPAQTLTDGATIPPIFVPLVGAPQNVAFRDAAVMHDAYCGRGNEDGPAYHARSWEDVHRMFHDALIANGVPPLKAKVMFAAVYLGGPRWQDPKRDLSAVPPERMVQEMEWCIRWIERMNPSRERIVAWMTAREPVLTGPAHDAPDWDALFGEAGR